MNYRQFGNNPDKISRLGFGAMRLPMIKVGGDEIIDDEKAVPLLQRAFDLGVNYLDTAFFYCNHKSQITCGKALKGYRDKVILSTKIPLDRVNKTDDYWTILESQLKDLDTDCIDYYHFHGIGYGTYTDKILPLKLLDQMEKAKSKGMIKHISFSFHDEPENMIKLLDENVFDSVLCQYNLFDKSNEKGMEHAHNKGIGVVVMGPVGGGRLAYESDVISSKMEQEVKGGTAEIALRFVFANPNVDCAISGMGNLEMLEQNARVASLTEPLTPSEYKNIDAMSHQIKELLYCTGCRYCMPCPAEINIPFILSQYNNIKVYGLTDYAKQELSKIGTRNEWTDFGKPVDKCIDCGKCEYKCPQKIKIREMLKETMTLASK